jgi:hypothetical protein
MTSGMLVRWHGLKRMLKTPHPKEAENAKNGPSSSMWVKKLKMFAII